MPGAAKSKAAAGPVLSQRPPDIPRDLPEDQPLEDDEPAADDSDHEHDREHDAATAEQRRTQNQQTTAARLAQLQAAGQLGNATPRARMARRGTVQFKTAAATAAANFVPVPVGSITNAMIVAGAGSSNASRSSNSPDESGRTSPTSSTVSGSSGIQTGAAKSPAVKTLFSQAIKASANGSASSSAGAPVPLRRTQSLGSVDAFKAGAVASAVPIPMQGNSKRVQTPENANGNNVGGSAGSAPQATPWMPSSSESELDKGAV